MTTPTEFNDPPNGHTGLLVYDTSTEKWYAILGSDKGALLVEVSTSDLPEGAATSAKQLPDGHAVTVDNADIAVTGDFYPETQPVSVAELPLPEGAATSAKQLPDGHAVTVDNPSLAVTGTFYPPTQPVSIATMPTITVQAGGGDKIFAFESIVEEALSNTNLDAGTNLLNGTAVPAGKIWKITKVSMTYVGTVPTSIEGGIVGLAGGMILSQQASPASGTWYFWQGELYMQAGDFARATVYGATAGDDFYFRYCGVQMDAP